MIREAILSVLKSEKVKRSSISKATGITQSILSNFLSGKTGMSIENLEKVFEYLNLHVLPTYGQETKDNKTLLDNNN